MPARDALENVLEIAGGGFVGLDARVVHGVTQIASADVLDRMSVERRLYNIAAVLPALLTAEDLAHIEERRELRSQGRENGFGGGGNGGSGGRADPERRVAEKNLSELLLNHVHPGSWRDNGGTVATFDIYGDVLAVTAPPATHREVRRCLDEIERLDADRPTAEGPATRPVMPGR